MRMKGEKPGKGLYICTHCGQKVRIENDTESMPPCPNCQEATFRRI